MNNRFPKYAPIPLAVMLLAGSAMAQQSVVEQCRATSSDADRIACLEAALLVKEPPTPAPTIAAEAAQPEVIPEPEPEATLVPAIERNSQEQVIIKPSATPVGIGAEQVIIQNQTREEQNESLDKAVGLAISGYNWVPYERLVVTFENGQVWRQIKGDRNRIRVNLDRNQTADITESPLGGYKLRLNEIRRTIRVERIK